MTLRMLTWLLIATGLCACGGSTRASGQVIRGQVVDAETGVPIPGSIVYALWQGSVVPREITFHSSMTACYHAEAVATDDRGQFVLNDWSKKLDFAIENGDARIRAYKSGYRLVAKLPASAPSIVGITIPLAPIPPEPDAMLREIVSHRQTCDEAGASRGNLSLLLRTLYDDARALPSTPEQSQRVEWLRRSLASIGADPGQEQPGER